MGVLTQNITLKVSRRLLTHIFLYYFMLTERHGTKDPAKVSELQNRVIGCLNDHVTFNTSAPNRANFLSRILLQLPELRVLSQKGLQRLYSLKVEDAVQAPPMVEKMFQPNLPY